MDYARELVNLQETLYTSTNPTRRWLHCSRRTWILNALQRYASSSRQRALEIGPGSGAYLPYLANLFEEVVASDIEHSYLQHASFLWRNHSNLQLVQDDITASALPLNSFDLILCTEVVEHITDSKCALQGMRKLLRPNGILVLSTPQRYSPLELASKIAFLPGIIQLVRKIYGEPILKTGHINLMTERKVRSQLLEAGFEVLEHNKSGMYIPLVAEFCGVSGLKFEQWLEHLLRDSRFNWLLWTQYYVARNTK